MTPITQLSQYIIHDTECDQIEPEVSLLLGMLINLEAEYLLEMKTKSERQQSLELLPPKIREDVKRQVLAIWNDTQKRYSDKELKRKW